MKRISITFLFFLIFLVGCSLDSRIVLNGEVVETIEVYSDYVDLGVSVPDGYTVLIDGTPNTYRLGENTITYTVLDENGETSKELTRIVNVVDTISPIITVSENNIVYIGLENRTDLFCAVEDNYSSQNNIIVTSNIDEVKPNNEEGIFEISITAEDSSGNQTTEVFSLNFILDYFTIIEHIEAYSDGIRGIVYSDYNDAYRIDFSNGNYVSIDENDKFLLFHHYSGSFGTGYIFLRGNLQDLTSIDISISIPESVADESWAMMYSFDISQIYTEFDTVFDYYDDVAEKPESQAITFFNEELLITIEEFQTFYEEVLGLTLN